MNNITATTLIRDRGQITLPYNIRDMFPWLNKNTALSIQTISQDNTIIIRPASQTKVQDWSSMWQKIKLARSFKSKNKVTQNGTEFIAQDRLSGHSI